MKQNQFTPIDRHSERCAEPLRICPDTGDYRPLRVGDQVVVRNNPQLCEHEHGLRGVVAEALDPWGGGDCLAVVIVEGNGPCLTGERLSYRCSDLDVVRQRQQPERAQVRRA